MRALVLVLAAACGPSSVHSKCTDPLDPGNLVITEVFADPMGGGGEWLEIYNNAERPVELEGLTVTHSRKDGSEEKSHVVREQVIAPEQYFTLGNMPADQPAPYIDYGYGGDLGSLYNTGGGKLALICGTTEIDSATYDQIKLGHSRELTAGDPPDAALNDDPANWCQSNATEFTMGNFGTPGEDNDCEPVAAGGCDDQGAARDIIPPGEGDLVITEVMPDPTQVSDATGEWFEIQAMKSVDLNGVALDRGGDAAPPMTLGGTECIHMSPGDYAVLAKTADAASNGGLPAASVLGTFSFALVAGTPTTPGDVRLLNGTTVIDAITWPGSTNGKALQLAPGAIDAISNDDPSNFCDATAPYGLGDLGTPGAANGSCPLVPPAGMCNDPATSTVRAIVKPTMGALVITEIMPNPKIEPGQEWFEITNTSHVAFDLNELGLDRAGDSRPPDVIHAVDCKSIGPGELALFARSADPATNAMLPPVDATFGFSMINSGGDVQVVDGATVLDAVTWASSTDGVSSQLEPAHFTTTDNDSAANFCAAVAPYGDGTNRGTPKAANACM